MRLVGKVQVCEILPLEEEHSGTRLSEPKLLAQLVPERLLDEDADLILLSELEVDAFIHFRLSLVNNRAEEVMVWQQEGPSESIHELLREVIQAIHEHLDVVPSALEDEQIENIPTTNFKAFCGVAMGTSIDVETHPELLEHGISFYENALEDDPDYVEALLSLSEALCMDGRSVEARNHLESFLTVHPDAPFTVLLALARAAHISGDTDESLRALDNILLTQPYCSPAIAGRAEIMMELGRYEEVTFDLRSALATLKDDLTLQRLLANALSMSGASDTCELLSALRDNNPDDLTLNLALVSAHLEAGRIESAIPPLRKVLDQDPENTFAGRTLPVLLFVNRCFGQAAILFFSALNAAPEDKDLHAELALALIELDDFDAAEALLKGFEEGERPVSASRALMESKLATHPVEDARDLLLLLNADPEIDPTLQWSWSIELAIRLQNVDSIDALLKLAPGGLGSFEEPSPARRVLVRRLDLLIRRGEQFEGSVSLSLATLVAYELSPSPEKIIKAAGVALGVGDVGRALVLLRLNLETSTPSLKVLANAISILCKHNAVLEANEWIVEAVERDSSISTAQQHLLRCWLANCVQNTQVYISELQGAFLSLSAEERKLTYLIKKSAPEMLKSSPQMMDDFRALPEKDFEQRFLKARLLQSCNALSEPLLIAGALVEEAPDDPDVRFFAGWVQENNGVAEESFGHWKAALSTQPQNPELLVLLGAHSLARGDASAAIVFFERALEASPADPQIIQALRAAVSIVLSAPQS